MNSFYDDFRSYTDPAKRVGWYDKLDQDLKFAFVAEMVSKTNSVLDLGSGLGDLSRFLSDQGHVGHYIGVEKDPSLFQSSQERYRDLQFFLQDFTSPPFHEADIAICIGGLLSAETISLEKVLRFLHLYPAFILIGMSETSTSTLRFEPNFVGIPNGPNSVTLNTNEVAILHNCKPRLSPAERLEELILSQTYSDESIARAFYGLGDKEKAMAYLRGCKSELARAMMSAWE